MIQAFDTNGWQIKSLIFRAWNCKSSAAASLIIVWRLSLEISGWHVFTMEVKKMQRFQRGRNTNGWNFPFVRCPRREKAQVRCGFRRRLRKETIDNVQFHTTSRRMPYSLVRLNQAWVLLGNLNHLNLLESLNSEQDTCARVAAAIFFGIFQVWKMQRSSRRLLSGTKSSNSTEQQCMTLW